MRIKPPRGPYYPHLHKNTSYKSPTKYCSLCKINKGKMKWSLSLKQPETREYWWDDWNADFIIYFCSEPCLVMYQLKNTSKAKEELYG